MSIEQNFRTVSTGNNDESIRRRFHLNETPVQWTNDPITGREKFRITIHIDGFHPNEVNFRVENRKLLIHGEHIELQNQSSTKKTIEKSFELPSGIDVNSHNVSFPNSTTMQIEFLTQHSNVIYQDNANNSKVFSSVESFRPAPSITESRSSSEFTSTRKLGTNFPSSIGSTFSRNSNSNSGFSYPEIRYGSNSNPVSESRNVEVREFSRRIGNTTENLGVDSSIFPRNFNSDAFYRSSFQPKVVSKSSGEKSIEMNLEIGNYRPEDIKISVDGTDLIVKAEHNEDPTPKNSSRAFFFKQTTLPRNTDFQSLASQYHPDGRLQISANLSDGGNSFQSN